MYASEYLMVVYMYTFVCVHKGTEVNGIIDSTDK